MWLSQGLRRLGASNVTNRAANAVLTRFQWQQLQASGGEDAAAGSSQQQQEQYQQLWQQHGQGVLGSAPYLAGLVGPGAAAADGAAPNLAPVLEELQVSLEAQLDQRQPAQAAACGASSSSGAAGEGTAPAEQPQQQQRAQASAQEVATVAQAQQQEQQPEPDQQQHQQGQGRAEAEPQQVQQQQQATAQQAPAAAAQQRQKQPQAAKQQRRAQPEPQQQQQRSNGRGSRTSNRSSNSSGGGINSNAAAVRGLSSLNERQLTAYITQQLYGTALRDMRSATAPISAAAARAMGCMGPSPAAAAAAQGGRAAAIEGYIRGAGSVLDSSARINTIHLAALLTRLAYLVREAQLPAGAVRDLLGLPQLLERVEALFPALAPSLDHQSLTNLLWAAAKLGQRPGPEFVTGVLDALQRVGFASVRPQGLANTLWALATIGPAHYTADERVARQLVAAVEDKAANFCTQDISNCLWSLATLAGGIAPTDHAGHASPAASSAAAASAAAYRPPPYVLDRVAGAALRQLGEFTPQGVANTLWALAKLEYSPLKGALLDALLAYVSRNLAAFPPQEMVNSVWAAGQLHRGPLPMSLLQRLEAHAARHLSGYLPLQVSALLTSFSALHYSPCSAAFVDGLRAHLGRTLRGHRAQELANTMLALGQLQIHPGQAALDAMRTRQAELMACGACRPQNIAAFNLGLGMLQPSAVEPRDLLAAYAFIAAHQHQHAGQHRSQTCGQQPPQGQSGAEGAALQAQLQQQLQALSQYAARLGQTLPPGMVPAPSMAQGGPLGMDAVAWAGMGGRAHRQDGSQQAQQQLEEEVSDTLRGALGTLPLRQHALGDGLVADLALPVAESAVQGVESAGKWRGVVVQACGPGDYSVNEPCVPRGERVVERALLQNLGWSVVEVDYQRWARLDASSRAVQLASELQAAGAQLPSASAASRMASSACDALQQQQQVLALVQQQQEQQQMLALIQHQQQQAQRQQVMLPEALDGSFDSAWYFGGDCSPTLHQQQPQQQQQQQQGATAPRADAWDNPTELEQAWYFGRGIANVPHTCQQQQQQVAAMQAPIQVRDDSRELEHAWYFGSGHTSNAPRSQQQQQQLLQSAAVSLRSLGQDASGDFDQAWYFGGNTTSDTMPLQQQQQQQQHVDAIQQAPSTLPASTVPSTWVTDPVWSANGNGGMAWPDAAPAAVRRQQQQGRPSFDASALPVELALAVLGEQAWPGQQQQQQRMNARQ